MKPNTSATVGAWARLLQPKYVFAAMAAAASYLLAQTDVAIPPILKVTLGLLLVIVALTDPNGPPEDHNLVDIDEEPNQIPPSIIDSLPPTT